MAHVKSTIKKILPKRIHRALAVLKNGVPPDSIQSAIARCEDEFQSVIARCEGESIQSDILPSVIPSMITASEAAFFAECAGGPLPAGGAIVDLGCFMGSTAIALAHGVLMSGRRQKVVAFDVFTWWDWMAGTPTHGVYLNGESFLPEARRYARDYGGGIVELNRIDLSEYRWDRGPIALLLVDAMKDFEVAGQIMRSFYTALLPGAVVIHQDFKHYYTSWIHVLQYRLRDRFQFLSSVSDGATVAFLLTNPINADEARAMSDFTNISDDEAERAFAYSMGLLPRDQTVNVAAAHVMYYHHIGHDDQARAILARYQALGLTQLGGFPVVMRLLREHDATLSTTEERTSAGTSGR